MCLFLITSETNYHKFNDFKQKNLSFHSSGGQKSIISLTVKVSAVLVPSRNCRG